MKRRLGVQTLFYPLPVLLIATYDSEGNPNCMNAAWGGIHDTYEVNICLASDHKTVSNILSKKAFTISFADKAHVKEADYFGIASGNDCLNKIEKSGLTVSKSETVDAPVLNELPITLECTVKSIMQDDNDTTFVVGTIKNVLVDDSVMDDKMKIDYTKFVPISYNPDTNSYHEMGGVVGIAFKDGMKFN